MALDSIAMTRNRNWTLHEHLHKLGAHVICSVYGLVVQVHETFPGAESSNKWATGWA